MQLHLINHLKPLPSAPPCSHSQHCIIWSRGSIRRSLKSINALQQATTIPPPSPPNTSVNHVVYLCVHACVYVCVGISPSISLFVSTLTSVLAAINSLHTLAQHFLRAVWREKRATTTARLLSFISLLPEERQG